MTDGLKMFIDRHMGEVMDIGSPAEAPPQDAIRAAEESIGAPLPPTYRWFVESYGGGYIFGDEIYSIASEPDPEIYQGDIAAMTLRFRSDGLIPPSDIALCATDYGEIYTFDSSRPDARGEYKVYRTVGGQRTEYADDFAHFIFRFVGDAQGVTARS